MLKGKIAVVTGGTRGIGYAIVKKYLENGAKVILFGSRQETVDKALASLKEENPEWEVSGACPSLTDAKEVADEIQAIHRKYGKIDILVNNAGVLESGLKPIDRFNDDDLDRIINTNEKGTMYCMRAALKYMKEWASIVNVASVAGVMGCGGAAYVASKAAIVGITKHTAMRYADKHIRCNAVCPGNILTPMTANASNDLDVDMITAMSKHNDLRVGSCTAEQVAGIILFMASDEAKPINGQILVSDFGSTL